MDRAGSSFCKSHSNQLKLVPDKDTHHLIEGYLKENGIWLRISNFQTTGQVHTIYTSKKSFVTGRHLHNFRSLHLTEIFYYTDTFMTSIVKAF